MSEIDISDFEFSEEHEADVSIELIKNEKNLIIYGLYSKIRSYQYHYNNVKLRCKILCSTWILATFLALGYLISGAEVGLPFNTFLGISILCIFSSTGIILLWFLDIVVYNRLLEVIFAENLELENKYSFLTKTHHDMAKLLIIGTTGPVIYDSFFYSLFVLIFLIISDFTSYIQISSFNKELANSVCMIFSIFIISLQIFMFFVARGASLKRFHKKYKK